MSNERLPYHFRKNIIIDNNPVEPGRMYDHSGKTPIHNTCICGNYAHADNARWNCAIHGKLSMETGMLLDFMTNSTNAHIRAHCRRMGNLARTYQHAPAVIEQIDEIVGDEKP